MGKNTPFSFHCMICFEEFDPDIRYPVVLPCGHTYVCHPCSERLDKCMECRTPLYTVIPRTSSNVAGPAAPPSASRTRASWSSSRSGGAHGAGRRMSPSQSPGERPSVAPTTKRRYPLPKNVVLLSLIEATELASADVRNKYSNSPRSDSGDVFDESLEMLDGSLSNFQDEEEDEEEKIKMGTSVAVSTAGTYAVANRHGMEIYPNRPSTESSNALSDEDVDTLVRFFHLDHKIEAETRETVAREVIQQCEKQSNKDPARLLVYGDRVQVVSIDGGWAKLARGYGFVRADNNQLVKVGGCVDQACKLEAMLRSLSNRRKELRQQQSKVDNKFIRLMNDLQHALQNEEDLTVICGYTFAASSSSAVPEEGGDKLSVIEEKATADYVQAEERNDTSHKKPFALERQVTPPAQLGARGFVCFANDVFATEDEIPMPCPRPQFLGAVTQQYLTTEGHKREAPQPRLFPAATHPSPSEMRAGARAWRERHMPAQQGEGIDFRTGMSGHMALLSTHAHPHEYLEPTLSNTTATSTSISHSIPRMSSHTGLSTSRQSVLAGVLGALKIPYLGFPHQERDEHGTVRHSGSM